MFEEGGAGHTDPASLALGRASPPPRPTPMGSMGDQNELETAAGVRMEAIQPQPEALPCWTSPTVLAGASNRGQVPLAGFRGDVLQHPPRDRVPWASPTPLTGCREPGFPTPYHFQARFF